ncbi:MAG: MBL fold metallo-hydrolase [Dehalococcoidia bacterium]|jgi:L-ascorbate metabolism protein UlaG (beta-lactamase superfamily)
MQIRYLGHSAFTITSSRGTKIITDPYNTSPDLTYGEIKASAHVVTVSHDHFDHSNVAAVSGNPKVLREVGGATAAGVKFRGVLSYHDENGGRLRGNNVIFCFEVDRVKVCHLGDLGHRLDSKQLREAGGVDVLLIPVGGYYTIDAEAATGVCEQLKPRVIIPMHYRTNKGLPSIAGVDDFLRGKPKVKWLDTSQVELKAGELPDAAQIIVLKPAL